MIDKCLVETRISYHSLEGLGNIVEEGSEERGELENGEGYKISSST